MKRRAPFLGLFGRLVLRDVVVHVGLALLSGLVLFVAIDTVETGNVMDGRGSAVDLLLLEVYNLPLVYQQLAVFAALVGSATAVGSLVRRGEVLAVFSAGGPPSSVAKPALLAGLIFAAGFAAVAEWITPPARAELAATRRRLGLPAAGADAVRRGQSWFRGRDLFYRIGSLEDQAGWTLGGVLMLRLEGGRLLDRWDVERLRWDGAGWIAEGCVHRALGADTIHTERHEERPLSLSELPEDFVVSVAAPHRLPYRALLETLRVRERLGQPSIEHRVELWRRHTLPLLNVLAVLLGAGVGLRLGKKPTFAAALAAGTGLGFFVWLMEEVNVAMATGAALSPGVATHLAPLILAAMGGLAWWIAGRRGIRGG